MRNHNSNLAFVDLLFNLILGFVFLFIISFILINEPKKNQGVEQKAEYMIILSWDDDLNNDIDLWVQGPSGSVGFRNPQQGNMFLDKDDLGHRNDVIINGGVEKIIYINREVVSIRGFQKGEYIVNAFYYNNGDKANVRNKVSIELIKINPFKVVYQGSKEFVEEGQEETFVRFTMDEDGDYKNINYLPKNIVKRIEDMIADPEIHFHPRNNDEEEKEKPWE
jgi:hypothetical protein